MSHETSTVAFRWWLFFGVAIPLAQLLVALVYAIVDNHVSVAAIGGAAVDTGCLLFFASGLAADVTNGRCNQGVDLLRRYLRQEGSTAAALRMMRREARSYVRETVSNIVATAATCAIAIIIYCSIVGGSPNILVVRACSVVLAAMSLIQHYIWTTQNFARRFDALGRERASAT